MEKSLVEFYENKSVGPDYHFPDCKLCYTHRVRSRQLRNPKKLMIQGAKERAMKKGLPFSITEDDFEIPERCPVFDYPLKVSRNGRSNFDSPSLDRVIPSLGYVPGNVVVISHRANMIKSNASAAEIRAVADWLERIT